MTLCGNAVCCHADLCTASFFGCENPLPDCDCFCVGGFVFHRLALADYVHCQVLRIACVQQIVLLFKCHFGLLHAHPALCRHTVCLRGNQCAACICGSHFSFVIDCGSFRIAASPHCLLVCAVYLCLDRDGVSLPLGIQRILALVQGDRRRKLLYGHEYGVRDAVCLCCDGRRSGFLCHNLPFADRSDLCVRTFPFYGSFPSSHLPVQCIGFGCSFGL